MDVKYITDENWLLPKKAKIDFNKLQPNSFIEVEYKSESQVQSIRSSYNQWRKKNNPEWTGGVRHYNNVIHIIRWQ